MQPQPEGPVNNFGQFQTKQVPQQGYIDNNQIVNMDPLQDPNQQQSYSAFANQPPQDFSQYNNSTFNNQPQGVNSQNLNSYPQPSHPQMGVVFGDPQKPSQNSSNMFYGSEKPVDKAKEPNRVSKVNRTLTFLGDIGNPGRGFNLLALISIFVILGLVIGLIAYHFGNKDIKLTSVSGGLQNIVNNLNSDPILDLTTAGSSLYCPAGTEAVHLGKWGGTRNGCNCFVTGLYAKSCDNDDWSCTSVQNIDSIDMYMWEGSVICAKRAQLNVDYVKASVCPSGFSSCSPGICIANSVSCPITSISIATSGTNSNLRFGTTSKYLAFSSVLNNAPVVELEISINNVPCFSTTEIPSGAGGYKLLLDPPSGCQKYGVDTAYSYEMDRLTNEAVFQANNFPSGVFNLPGYRTVLQNTPTLLSGRKRIDVANKDACLSLDTSTIINASNASENMNLYMSATSITAMAVHGFLVLFTLIILFSMKSTRTWREIFLGAEVKQWLPFYMYFGFAEIIIFIIMVALARSAQADMTKARNYLEELDQLSCFPSGAPKQVVADYNALVNSVASNLSGLSIALLVISVVSYVPIVLKLFFKWRAERIKNKKTFTY